MLKFLTAALKFIAYLFSNREEQQKKEEKRALYEANKALLERDRGRAGRRKLRLLKAKLLREDAAKTVTTTQL